MASSDPLVVSMTVPGPALQSLPGSTEVPVRVYTPVLDPWATLVWAHGGSFVRGTLDWPEADWVSRQFADSGIRVISVDYVLASDTVKAPAPSNDVAAVVAWAAAEYTTPLVVGGASAGGHLAVLATLNQVDRQGARQAQALLLEYPTLHRVQRDHAVVAAATSQLPEQRRFGPERIAEMYEYYLGETGAPIAGELPASRLALLPPTIIVNADADDLRVSAEEFAEQLRAAGVTVSETVQAGTVHGYMNRPDESAQALSDATATIARFVNELRTVLVH
ncbi:alpha/beta hydrolase [Leucobacter denitrificans]|uniref:Alpha/beta hydrolase n=1 Tax=Leucobacter denitrificans TaxID=683042 RepID=A0A7G9S257_9MICO|nr:alpha/beta hydrolase [Leucobacter denitrificans]QNN61932.1 alpha/beta hydrolase [Leucobacter denitrificans]